MIDFALKLQTLKAQSSSICVYTQSNATFSFTICRHNDLPYNIRKFVHNQIQDFNFSSDLRKVEPWSLSKWSHTDLVRLQQGMVGCQVQCSLFLHLLLLPLHHPHTHTYGSVTKGF